MADHPTQFAVFGGGCFWCTEAVYRTLNGVESVTPGYAGGETDQPTYETVSSGTTGHAEVVRVEYDPSVISYPQLLDVFFVSHDPTTPNRQGQDIGTQYRSVILYADADQKADAEVVIARLTNDGTYDAPIITELRPLKAFFPAEEHHRDYYAANRSAPYCQLVIDPKLTKVRERYAALVKREV